MRLVSLLALPLFLLLIVACEDDASSNTPSTPENQTFSQTAEGGNGAVTPGVPSPTPVPVPPVELVAATCPGALPEGITPGEAANRTLQFGGHERPYSIYVPSAFENTEKLPVVFSFHGLGGTALQQDLMSGLPEVAEASGFVVVSPEGTGSPRSWRIPGAESTFPGATSDLEFFPALLNTLLAELCLDTSSVYLTGFSNGALFASTLACLYPDLVAASAPVAGVEYPASGCQEVVPTLAFHGTGDMIVPFDQGEVLDRVPYDGARAEVLQWAQLGECQPIAYPEPLGEGASREGYDGCEGNAEVALVVLDGLGHSWPGNDNSSISAAEVMWEFFTNHHNN